MPLVPGQDENGSAIERVRSKRAADTTDPTGGGIDAVVDRISKQRVADIQYSLGEGQKIDQGKAERAIRLQLRTNMNMDFVSDALEPLEAWEKAQKGTTLDFIKSMPPALGKYIREHKYYAAMTDDELKKLNDLVSFTTMPRQAWPKPAGARAELAKKLAPARAAEKRAKLEGDIEGRAFLTENFDQEVYEETLAEINQIEEWVSGKDKIGVLERTKMRYRENPAAIAPVISGIFDTANYLKIQEIAAKDGRGEELSDQEEWLLETAARVEYAANRRGFSFLSDVSNIVQESIPFGLEFAMTGGAAKLGGAAVRSAFQRAIGGTLNSTARSVVRTGAELGIQTALAQGVRIPGKIADEATPDIVVGERGGYTIIEGSGKGLTSAIPTALYRAFVEVSSERAGRALDFLDRPLHAAIFGWWRGRAGAKASFKSFQKDLRKFGIHGVIGENFEEEVAKIMNIAAGDDYEVTSLRELAARTIAFSVPMAGHAALSMMRPGKVDADALKSQAALMAELPKILETNPEKFEEIVGEHVKGTPNEFRWVTIADFNKYAESKGVAPEALAEEIVGSSEVYTSAKNNKTDIQIRTERALTTLLKDGAGFWQDKIKQSPHEETEEESAESLKRIEEKRGEEEKIQKQIDEAIKPLEKDLRSQAEALAAMEEGGDVEEAYTRIVERERSKMAADLTKDPTRFYDAASGQVGDIIRRGLLKAGRPAYQVEAQAVLAEAFFRTVGIRESIDPVELLYEANLRFANKGKLVEGGLEQPMDAPAEQPGGSEPRGQYVPKTKAKSATLINFLENADASTFLHESGHWYLDLLSDLAGRSTASEGIKADFQKILDWFGVKDRSTWEKLSLDAKRPYHEKWAQSFESYLKTGNAPSVTLRDAFAKFRAWLVLIYENFTGKLAEPSAEIRGVMDRMLATEAEIREAATIQGIEPIPSQALGIKDEKEAAEYDASIENVTQRGQEKLLAELTRDVWNAQKAWTREELSKIREEVAAEVDQEPIYNLRSILRRNTFADGSATGKEPVRLDMETIVRDFGGRGRLRRLIGMYTKEGGIHPQQVAEMFGYRTADEMLTALETTESKGRKIDRLALERFQAKYGEQMTQEEIAEEAMKAVNNEALDDLLVIQSRKLAQLSGKKSTPIKILREYAVRTIRAMTYRQTHPRLYERAAAKAAREAFEFAAKGEHAKAFDAKQVEILNRLLYRQAVHLRERVERGQSYVDKFNSPVTRGNIGKAGHDYLERIEEILEEYDFRPATNKQLNRRERLRDWVEAKEKEARENGNMSGLVVDSRLMRASEKKHYKDLSLEEFEAVIDGIQNIEHIAQTKNKLLKSEGQREYDETKLNLISTIIGNHNGKFPPKGVETTLPADSFGRTMRQIDAFHRKASFLAKMMDGWQEGGLAWEILIRPMNEAGDAQAVMHEKAAEALGNLFSAYSLEERAKIQWVKEYIPAIDMSLSKQGRLLVALNWGNLDNRQKLMEGHKWTEEQVKAILDTLDKRDWEFVRGVWAHLESYWKDVAALNKRVTGLEPEKVEAADVHTKFGTFSGGYFPLKYNSDISTRASDIAEQNDVTLKTIGKALIGSTRHGHREARTQSTGMPIRLDFGVIFQHVQEVIHDLTHYEYVRDAGKILQDREVQEAIREHYGNAVYQQLRNVVKDIAAGDVKATNVFERSINWIRQGTTISAMAWNFSTAALQGLGITQSISNIGAQWVGRGLSKWWTNGLNETVQYVHAKSDLMAHRARTMMREINEVRNSLSARGAAVGWMEETYFYMIAKAQMTVDIPTWLGAYEKAQETNPQVAEESQEEADKRWVQMANQAVLDSQGGGQIKDLAAAQRGGPLMKLFSNFYSFFSTTYNLTGQAIGRTDFKDPGSVGRLAADMLLLYSIPATLGLFIREGLRGGLGDDDEKEIAKKLVREHVSYALGTMVGVREFASAIYGFSGYEGPAGTRGFAVIGRLFQQVGQGEADLAAVRALNEAGGVFLHYPSSQLNKLLSGIVALSEGDTKNPLAPLFGPPPKN